MTEVIVNGIRCILADGATVGDYHGLVTQATAEMIQFRETWGDDEYWAIKHTGDLYTLKRENGEEVVMMGPVPTIGPEEEEEEPEKEILEGPDYVLLVEMGTGLTYDSGRGTPPAVAIFSTASGGRLEPAGYTKNILEDNLDPPGIIGQETFRTGWVSDPEGDETDDPPMERIEQVKRVDQGHLAYDGDHQEEETTYVAWTNNVWSWEDIPYSVEWKSVTPGAPPVGLCGYTWDIYAEYGGPGLAQYHDTEHLFYYVKSGDLLTHWWPPYFNQWIEEWQYYNQNAGCCRYNGLYDDNWYLGIGAVSGLLFANTGSQIKVTLNRNKRRWGCIYVNMVQDYGTSEEPWDEVSPQDMQNTKVNTDYWRWFYDNGVYVNENVSMFIQGLKRGTGGWRKNGKQVVKREAVDDPAHFDQWVEGNAIGSFLNGFSDPAGDLDTLHLQVLEGNADTEEWPENYSPFTYLYSVEYGYTTREPMEIVINCGGTEHFIAMERQLGSRTISGYTEPVFESVSFPDAGIFTKDGTGVNEDNEVDAATIEPIYAFSVMRDAPKQIAYGMVIDGELFLSQWFTSGSNNAWSIPTTESSELLASNYVRVGLRWM